MSDDLTSWTDAYEAAPSEPPHGEALIADSEDELRAIACALKGTGWPAGAMSAAAGAGVVLARLRLAGWDVVRSELAARKVFDPVPDKWAFTPAHVDDRIHREWLSHLPLPGLADVRAAAEDMHKAEGRLDDAVTRARSLGRSWADVGKAAGITRQSAHERWARR